MTSETPPRCNCRHWSPPPGRWGGACSLGLFGGRPGLSVCGRCDRYDGLEPRLVAYVPPAPVPPAEETPERRAERELVAAAADPQGLGDHAAALIHTLGADRVWKLVRSAAGQAEGCGGCNDRRKALNRLGEWMKDKLGLGDPGR